MKITRKTLLSMQRKKTQNPDTLFPSPKSSRCFVALKAVSYLVTQYCLGKLATPNEVVVWATVTAQGGFQTLFT